MLSSDCRLDEMFRTLRLMKEISYTLDLVLKYSMAKHKQQETRKQNSSLKIRRCSFNREITQQRFQVTSSDPRLMF